MLIKFAKLGKCTNYFFIKMYKSVWVFIKDNDIVVVHNVIVIILLLFLTNEDA